MTNPLAGSSIPLTFTNFHLRHWMDFRKGKRARSTWAWYCCGAVRLLFMLVWLSSLQFVSQSWGMLNVSTSTFQASSGCAARFAKLSQDTRFSESDMCRKTSLVARLLSRREVSLKFLNVHKVSADRGASAYRLVFVRRKILPTILWVAFLFGTASSTLLFTAFTHSKMMRRSSVGKGRSDIMKPSSEILPGDSGWVSKRPSLGVRGVQLIWYLAIRSFESAKL